LFVRDMGVVVVRPRQDQPTRATNEPHNHLIRRHDQLLNGQPHQRRDDPGRHVAGGAGGDCEADRGQRWRTGGGGPVCVVVMGGECVGGYVLKGIEREGDWVWGQQRGWGEAAVGGMQMCKI
jgi:hypothetical protein